MSGELDGRVALVTGAGSPDGIGFATARMLAQRGASIFLTSTTDRCRMRADELAAAGHAAAAASADLTIPSAVDGLISNIVATFGRIDILVNNAGMTSVSDPIAAATPVHELWDEDWRHAIERNLTTVFTVTRRVLPMMLSNQWGRIVNVASTTGTTGAMHGEAAYAAAKAGVVGFTRTLALEYAPQGITANAVAPGWIATASQTEHEQAQGRATPIGRSGTSDEVAAIIAAICSPSASYLTGQCIVIDGGNAIAEERA